MQPMFSAASAPTAAPAVKDVTTATFMTDVIDASMDTPIIVDFWAPWCGPCKTLGPALEKIVAATKGAVRMVKINVDENQDLAGQMRIQSIPAVYAFFGGRPVDGFVGAQPESQLKSFVDRLAKAAKGAGAGGPSPLEEALAQAKQALSEGDLDTAASFYGQILQHDPTSVEAMAGLGRCMLVKGDLDKAKSVLARIPADEKHADVVALRTGIDLAEQAAKSGPLGELEAKIAADPADYQARFDLALALFAKGNREEAIDHLLEIVRRDRTWEEDGARKQIVKFFEAMGPMDPLTISARKRLSSLLFR